jgi:hypothetical protein
MGSDDSILVVYGGLMVCLGQWLENRETEAELQWLMKMAREERN